MNKINNKLIFTLGILTFIFGSLSASPVYASPVGIMDSGSVTFNPNYSNNSYSNPRYNYNNNYQPYYNNPTVIPGCEGRDYGFSTVNGQSCIGNYVVPNTNNSSQNTTTSSANTFTNTKNTSNTTSTVSKTTDMNNTTTTSNNNENTFSGVTANALEGSNTFLPSGLMQWIILAIMIAAIIFLWRYVHAEEKYLSEPLKHA